VIPVFPAVGRAVAQLAAVIPAVLLVLLVGLLCLIGLFCDDKRRKYVTGISERALQTVQVIFGDGPGSPALRG
jgi:hypothetical protein